MITISIHRKTLKRHAACADGLALYDRVAALQGRPDRIRTRWTRLHELWLATAYPGFAAWLRGKGMIPRLSFVHADLRGANLVGANLDGAYRSAADPAIAGWERGAYGQLRRKS